MLFRSGNQKIIIYCHHDFQDETKKLVTKYKGIWSWYYKPYYSKIKKFLNQIKNQNIQLISNSKFVQESIKKRFEKDSTVIYPPVDLKQFEQNPFKENSVVTIARYSKEKNLEFGLNVIKELGINYSIIGNTTTKTNELYFQKLHDSVKNQTQIQLMKNIPRNELIKILGKSKVYFHASPETFGISIIEAIASGCIPVVPDNSAHIETVPFPELRYEPNNTKDAQKILLDAINGKYDYLIESLKKSLKQYDKDTFKEKFLDYIKNL